MLGRLFSWKHFSNEEASTIIEDNKTDCSKKMDQEIIKELNSILSPHSLNKKIKNATSDDIKVKWFYRDEGWMCPRLSEIIHEYKKLPPGYELYMSHYKLDSCTLRLRIRNQRVHESNFF